MYNKMDAPFNTFYFLVIHKLLLESQFITSKKAINRQNTENARIKIRINYIYMNFLIIKIDLKN